MATTRKKIPTVEDLKILDGDFVDYSGFAMCKPKQCCVKRKRKLNFNVVWFTIGTMFGMLMTAGMINWIFLLS